MKVATMRELLGCLFLVAAYTMSFTQVQLNPYRAAAAAFAAPSRGAATPASFRKRADLLSRSGAAKRNLSVAEILHSDQHRIASIQAKLHRHAGAGGAATTEPMASSNVQVPLYSGQIVGTVNYILRVGLGTPPQDLYLVIDTGSNVAWTQCNPCDVCYMQVDPIFDPSASSSYQQVPCISPQCIQLISENMGACSSSDTTSCSYTIQYLDGSSTTGDFALETLSLGGDVASTAYPFGCGHQNKGLFEGYDGLIGLSRDSLAFPAQTKESFGEVFSYCMPPIFSSSAGYIEFGASSGDDDGSTPLVGLSESTYYTIELESVQVEGTSSMSQPTNKEMVVDSGTVITRLDRPLYEQVRAAFMEAASSLQEAPEGAGMGFDTCYIANSTSLFPHITFTFKGGLIFTPAVENIIIIVDNNGTTCLALLPFDSKSGFSILGNYQQQGRLFTFDISESTISISSNAC